jgi:hypothetical protein
MKTSGPGRAIAPALGQEPVHQPPQEAPWPLGRRSFLWRRCRQGQEVGLGGLGPRLLDLDEEVPLGGHHAQPLPRRPLDDGERLELGEPRLGEIDLLEPMVPLAARLLEPIARLGQPGGLPEEEEREEDEGEEG